MELAAPELLVAFFYSAPHVHQLVPPHVVEGPSFPGLVSGDLDPVNSVIHATIAAHPVSVSHPDQVKCCWVESEVEGAEPTDC